MFHFPLGYLSVFSIKGSASTAVASLPRSHLDVFVFVPSNLGINNFEVSFFISAAFFALLK
jgi:hypothetical protein